MATLLDLVARGWLRIEHTEHEVVAAHRPARPRGRRAEGLRAAGAQPHPQDDGRHADRRLRAPASRSPACASPRRWWRRFTRSVVADARRQRLSKRRWNVLAVGPPVVTCVLAGLAVVARRPHGRRRRGRRLAGVPRRRRRRRPSPSSSSAAGCSSGSGRAPSDRRTTASCAPSTGSACGPGWRRGASRARRRSPPTAPAGRSPTPPRWGSPSGPPTSCRSCPRTTAWPGATPPASGTSCASATRSAPATAATRRSCSASASLVGAGLIALQRYLLGIARGDRFVSLLDDFPDQTDLIQDVALVARGDPDRCRCCGWPGSSSPAPSTCSRPSSARASSCGPAGRSASCRSPACCARSPAATASPCSSPSTTAGPTASARGCPTSARPCRRAPGPGSRRRRCSGYVRRSEPIGTHAAVTAHAADPRHQRRRHRLRRPPRAGPGDGCRSATSSSSRRTREYSGAGAALGALHLLQPEVRRAVVEGVAEAWTVNGTPGLCVMFARLGVFGPVDLVVSGINPGANVGRAIYHSGTVGAALTARNGGTSGVAVSQAVAGYGVEGQGWDEMIAGQHWDTAAQVGADVVAAVLDAPPAEPVVVNVNVPNVPFEAIRGWRHTEVALLPPRTVAVRSAAPDRGPRRACFASRWCGATPSSCRRTPTAAPSSGARSPCRTSAACSAEARARTSAPSADRLDALLSGRSYTPVMTERHGDRSDAPSGTPCGQRYLLPRDERPATTAPRRAPHRPPRSDVARTIDFYQGLLGFPLTELFENRDYQGSTHFFFDIGNGNALAFFDFPGLDLPPYAEVLGGHHHLAISVEPAQWQVLKGRLDDAGIEYLEVGGVSLYFRGPTASASSCSPTRSARCTGCARSCDGLTHGQLDAYRASDRQHRRRARPPAGRALQDHPGRRSLQGRGRPAARRPRPRGAAGRPPAGARRGVRPRPGVHREVPALHRRRGDPPPPAHRRRQLSASANRAGVAPGPDRRRDPCQRWRRSPPRSPDGRAGLRCRAGHVADRIRAGSSPAGAQDPAPDAAVATISPRLGGLSSNSAATTVAMSRTAAAWVSASAGAQRRAELDDEARSPRRVLRTQVAATPV